MPLIQFHSADRPIPLRERARMKTFIETIFRRERWRLSEVRYIFCSDEYLLQVNRNFLQHDYYTDIITFGLSQPGEAVEAEIYISTDRVRDNAIQLGHSFKQELFRVMFHGALHLCGYKDKKKSEITTMRQKEDEYLRLFEKNN